jgi:hypothetical protein
MRELPQVGDEPPGGRADAIRNRRQLLSAAAEFVNSINSPLEWVLPALATDKRAEARPAAVEVWSAGPETVVSPDSAGKKLARIEEKYDRVVGDGEVPVVFRDLRTRFSDRQIVETIQIVGAYWAFARLCSHVRRGGGDGAAAVAARSGPVEAHLVDRVESGRCKTPL